jgi:hypothetical protein
VMLADGGQAIVDLAVVRDEAVVRRPGRDHRREGTMYLSRSRPRSSRRALPVRRPAREPLTCLDAHDHGLGRRWCRRAGEQVGWTLPRPGACRAIGECHPRGLPAAWQDTFPGRTAPRRRGGDVIVVFSSVPPNLGTSCEPAPGIERRGRRGTGHNPAGGLRV